MVFGFGGPSSGRSFGAPYSRYFYRYSREFCDPACHLRFIDLLFRCISFCKRTNSISFFSIFSNRLCLLPVRSCCQKPVLPALQLCHVHAVSQLVTSDHWIAVFRDIGFVCDLPLQISNLCGTLFFIFCPHLGFLDFRIFLSERLWRLSAAIQGSLSKYRRPF